MPEVNAWKSLHALKLTQSVPVLGSLYNLIATATGWRSPLPAVLVVAATAMVTTCMLLSVVLISRSCVFDRCFGGLTQAAGSGGAADLIMMMARGSGVQIRVGSLRSHPLASAGDDQHDVDLHKLYQSSSLTARWMGNSNKFPSLAPPSLPSSLPAPTLQAGAARMGLPLSVGSNATNSLVRASFSGEEESRKPGKDRGMLNMSSPPSPRPAIVGDASTSTAAASGSPDAAASGASVGATAGSRLDAVKQVTSSMEYACRATSAQGMQLKGRKFLMLAQTQEQLSQTRLHLIEAMALARMLNCTLVLTQVPYCSDGGWGMAGTSWLTACTCV